MMMARLKSVLLLLSAALLTACAAQPGEDYGIDSKKLTSLQATIWTDPLGCEHWVADDLAEGYMTARRNRDGTPRCPNPVSNRQIVADIPVLKLEMSLWTDSNGCQHWIRDDGGEGFMTERLDRMGRPVCPGATQSARSETITLSADALFDTDEAALRPTAIAELETFGRKMQQIGKTQVFIVGHTDSRASDSYNQRLSERRAASVAKYLIQNFGLVAQTEGRGEREPVASNDTREGRQANRRVAISILN